MQRLPLTRSAGQPDLLLILTSPHFYKWRVVDILKSMLNFSQCSDCFHVSPMGGSSIRQSWLWGPLDGLPGIEKIQEEMPEDGAFIVK